MTLLELILETAIKEAGEFKDIRLSKEDAEYMLALLKEREPRVLTWEELIDVTNPVWYEERNGISSWALCTDVTRGNAYEDMSYEFFENYDNSYIREYADKCNVYWRCWTTRPTDEQREVVKWNGFD